MKSKLIKKYGKYPHQINDLPTDGYWVIFRNRSISIPGDERSRTNPGHGYPESTEYFLENEIFINEDDFKHEVTRLTEENLTNWCAAFVNPIHISVQVTFEKENERSNSR